ncbi:MAG: paraquat-inducible protein A [Campylobacterota bacterium]|nr:paraquat-inducible protein A [Campylobacterota bacterium]
MKPSLSYIIMTIFTTGLLFFANTTYQHALNYEAIYTQLSKEEMMEEKMQNNPQKMVSELLGALLGEKIERPKKENKLELEKLHEQEKVQQYLIYFSLLLSLSLLLYFILDKIIFLLYINIASLISLAYGVLSPIFLVYVQKELPLVGNVVLQFESNTLISSIEKLFTQENYFVGMVILVFSIFFPIVKTLFMISTLYLKNTLLDTITNATTMLSKWSMTDVFVLSIFLIYLSSTKDGMIQSEIEVGFYFFFIYVILSLISSMIFKLNSNNN